MILLPDVMDYLEELAEVLHEKEYLSFEETALTYVQKDLLRTFSQIDTEKDYITLLFRKTNAQRGTYSS